MRENRYLDYWAAKAKDPEELYLSMSMGALSNVSKQSCYDAWNRTHPQLASRQPPAQKEWWQ